jgi:uncharacterized repeat protein (TIGR01451 family)
MKKQYLYKLGKTSKRVASVLSAITLGFGNQLLLPQVGLTQTAGVGITTPSFTIIDDGCTVSSTNADSGDTITIATNLTNSTGSDRAFRVVFRATASRGGTTRNLSEDLLYGGPTYMNRTPSVGGSNWDDSYGQVTNTPIVASGGNFTVRTNFGLNNQQLINALGLSSGSSTPVTFIAEVFSSDFSVYYGAVSASRSVTFNRSCPTGRLTNTTAALLTTNKPVYATTEQITIENATIGAADNTTTPSTSTGSQLPSWGDTLNDIIDIIRLDVPPTGDPEQDYLNNVNTVATSLSSWTRNDSLDSGSRLDERTSANYYYSRIVGTTLIANTNYTSIPASSLIANKYYLVRFQSRLGISGTKSNAGSSSHPVLRPQYTYFAVGSPAPVGGSPDLTVTKTHTGNFSQGGTGTYTITAKNSGTVATSGTATISDTLPTGLTPTSATGTGWTCTISGQTVTCTSTTVVAAGASYPAISLGVNVASNAASSITNTATVAGGGETTTTNNSASDPTTINGVADLTVSKTHTGNFTQGLPGTYTITATNSGGAATSGTVTVSDTLPTGMTPTSASGTGWTCTVSGQIVTCTRSDALAAGTSYPAITLNAVVASNAPASLTNTATISGGGQTNTTNDSASDPTTITAVSDLTIAKTHTGNFTRGSTGSYSIVVTNSGTVATNGTVTVNDTLPAGLTLNGTPSGTGWSCTATSTTAFSCTRLDVLNPGSSYPAITASVNVAQTAANTVTNTATVSGVGEANTNNNSASDATNIVSSADLGITKTDNQTVTTAGSSINYTITATNNGPSTLNSVTVTDTVPSAIQNPTFTPSTGSYNNSTGVWTGLSLATGQSVTLTMTGTVSSTAAGTITNTATVAAPSGTTDPTATNNTATDTTNIYTVAPTAGKVIINEVLYAQTGTTAAANDEFIEIYNASNSTVDLSGWKLMDGNIIANSTDGTGSITGNSSPYTFPSGTTLAAGQYAVIWVGNNTSTNQATGATFQAWLGQSASLNNTGDDVWLYDSQTAIVDYIAYGSGTAINTPPPTSLNLWNTTYQASLSGASNGQSISLTANGQDGNASACWEPTTSGQANGRCTGYLPTRDTDTVGVRVTTVGQNNNGALAPLLLLVKRITAINTTSITSFVDDPNTTNDNSAEWPASSYLKGAIDGGAVKPGDTVEYTIYFLSDGGSSAQKVNMCDLVPANTTFLPDAFASGSGIAQATGSAAPVNLTNAADTDGGQYVTAGSSLPTGVSCNNSNTNGAAIVNLGNIPNAIGSGSPSNSYGFIRFKVKVK